jgi:hypothetical protein
MNLQGMNLLEIYVMLSPFVVLAIGLGVFWLTGWMDRREARRYPAE